MNDLLKDLIKIVPNWQKVKLTKKGYNTQYVATINKLAEYINEREEKSNGRTSSTKQSKH